MGTMADAQTPRILRREYWGIASAAGAGAARSGAGWGER